jgi:hypothetical protein
VKRTGNATVRPGQKQQQQTISRHRCKSKLPLLRLQHSRALRRCLPTQKLHQLHRFQNMFQQSGMVKSSHAQYVKKTYATVNVYAAFAADTYFTVRVGPEQLTPNKIRALLVALERE